MAVKERVWHDELIKTNSLSVGIFTFNKIAAFYRDSSKQSFSLGICVDCGRTSHSYVAFNISAEWSSSYCEVATKRQVAAFGKRVDGRFARQNYHKVCHLQTTYHKMSSNLLLVTGTVCVVSASMSFVCLFSICTFVCLSVSVSQKSTIIVE